MKLRLFSILLSMLTVCSASLRATVDFYVDPDFSGSTDGSALRPWTELNSNAVWGVIDSTLATTDVVVYLSAREASSDVNQSTSECIKLLRNDTGTHTLVIDGMSKYNTDDANPVWVDYEGTSRYEIKHNGPVTTANNSEPYALRSNFILRGVIAIATANQPIYLSHVKNAVVEYCEATQVGGSSGPGIHLAEAGHRYSNNVVIRHNVVHGSYGEGIYVNGPKESPAGYAGSDITIEGNTIFDPGRGGQGDGIDVKDGVRNVILKENIIYMSIPGDGVDGIVTNSGATIDGNFIYNFGSSGISFGIAYNMVANRDNSRAANNIIVNCGGGSVGEDVGIVVRGKGDGGDEWKNVLIVYNTIVGIRDSGSNDGHGINLMSPSSNTTVMNNIIVNCQGYALNVSNSTLGLHGSNIFFSASDGYLVNSSGNRYNAASLTDFENGISADPRFLETTAPPYSPDSFRLQGDSPAIDKAVFVSSVGVDFAGEGRDQDSPDIGAYEFTPVNGSVPVPPTQTQISAMP